MTNKICECFDSDEKIILLKCLETNKRKLLKDLNNEMVIKNINTMRDDLNKLEKTIDKVLHIPLC